MITPITIPLWLFVLVLLFAAVTFASHFLFPSVRWFLRRRMEKAVAQLNTRLDRPIEPFRLLRRFDLIQRLIYDPEVTQAIVDHARANGVREDVAFQRARAYAREIVPSFSAYAYFGWGVWLARKLSNALYRVRLGHFAEDALKDIDPEATVVFVMNHRSNMDYVLVTHLAADRSALSYAVGEWAHVWPLSRLIRAMGAYFIRRKSRDPLYRRVLKRYVQMATEGGVTQAIFPEGGLSLTGAVAPPKVGLLSYMIEDFDPEGRDVVFVPVGVNYDRVLEDRVLIQAGKSEGPRFDARITHVSAAIVKQLWLRVTGRFHRFGYAAVSFGAPVSMRAHPDLTNDPQALAESLLEKITQVIPVLPVPLVAWLIETAGAQTRADIERGFSDALARLHGSHVHLARGNRDYSVEVGLRALTERGVIAQTETGVVIVEGRQDLLTYYANSIRHLL